MSHDGAGAGERYAEGGYFDHGNPYLERLLEPGHVRMLEVGCGAAALGARWKAADPSREVWGIELDPRAAALAAGRIDRVVEADLDAIEGLPPEAGRFDLITFGDVLEHLRDPGRLLDLMREHLSPQGEILACVPNVGHWTVVTGLLTGRFDYADEGLLDRTHVHLFTPATFRELLAEHGFPVVTLEERIRVPGPVTGALAQAGAALAGDPALRDRMELDLETYQTVFRARPAVSGVPAALVVASDLTTDREADRALEEYLSGFRAGEPVRLLLAVEAGAEVDPSLVDGFLSRTRALLDRHLTPVPARPDLEVVGYDSTRPLHEQLPEGSGRYVAVGSRAGEQLPGADRCGPARLEMLRAVRSAA